MWNLLLLASTLLITQICADKYEYILYDRLMRNYSRLERPVANNSVPVVVNLGLILQQIVGVDEKNQIIEVNAWIKYTWIDYKLKWNPDDYGGVSDLRFPVDMLWRPDVLVYNSADTEFDSTYPSNIIVYNTGSVLWIPPGILRTSCKIDIRWFPFDDQSCHIKFGSWTYHGFALDLQPENPEMGADISEYMTNGEWLLLSTPVTRHEKFYDCCPEPYVDVKFYLNIRRRTLYYGFNLIIPSLLISLMTVLGFTLPPDAGEKITLEITILLSVCFFLSIVADMTPPTSEAVPLIGTFFTCCMVVVSASVVFTVVVLNLHYRTPDTHEMSPFCRSVLLNYLPWLLMMRRPGHTFEAPPIAVKIMEVLLMSKEQKHIKQPQYYDELKACCRGQRSSHAKSKHTQLKGGSATLVRNVRTMERANKLDAMNGGASTHMIVVPPTLDATSPTPTSNQFVIPSIQVTSPCSNKVAPAGAVNSVANVYMPAINEEEEVLSSKCSEFDGGSTPTLERVGVSPAINSRRLTMSVLEHRRQSINLEAKITNCVQPILDNPNKIDPGVHALILMMQRIHNELKFIVTRMEKTDVDEDAIADWKFAAMVVDRVCLIVFSAFIVASTCGIMFSAPNITS